MNRKNEKTITNLRMSGSNLFGSVSKSESSNNMHGLLVLN